MKLSLENLYMRHDTWKWRIGEAGIWDPDRFMPVTIQIKKASRCYNGMFHRSVKLKNFIKVVKDKIIIYNKVEDFDLKFLDSVLVHEMIHQYIFQTGLKDTSSHGKYFRHFMSRINKAFPQELNIRITDTNPALPKRGPGETTHKLLLAYFEKDQCYCAVIHPSKIQKFDELMRNNRFSLRLKNYVWAESNDVYFNQYRRCTLRFHGIKKNLKDMIEFCREYNVRKATFPVS